MDFRLILGQLRKYKWLVVLFPLAVVCITFVLVKQLPKQYESQAQLSTGLLDPTKKVISNETVDFFSVNQQFANIVEKLTMKKLINQLTYKLVLHDLENPKKTFNSQNESLRSYKSSDREALKAAFAKKAEEKSLLTLEDNRSNLPLYDIANAMGYGEDDIRRKLEVGHAGTSDLITVTYTSENPALSAFVVNTLSTEFIGSYSSELSLNQNVSAKILDSLLLGKKTLMDTKNTQLSEFKKTKGVLNLNEQSATVYNQISVYEAQRAEAIRTIQSNSGAIATITAKLGGSDRYINGSSRVDNREIVNLKRQLQLANNAFIDGGFKPSEQRRIDSLTRLLNNRSARNLDENAVDPGASRQELIQQKLSLEIALQQARSSIRSIDAELGTLRGRYKGMVPFDADIQNYERDAELATKDYMTALDRFNLSKTDQKLGLNLEIEQLGLPGNPKPSKKVMYVAASGMGSLFLSLGFVLLMVAIDFSIKDLKSLEKATNSVALGSLSVLPGRDRDIKRIWSGENPKTQEEVYREQIRSIRFEIFREMEIDGSKILGITSLNDDAGKTFISYSLAYSFARTGKKVLLIADELPQQQSDEKGLTTGQSFQTFLIKKEFRSEDLVTVMNKSSGRNSLLELQNIGGLKSGFDTLKNEFDFIIIDINSLSDVNISKEWLMFSQKNIGVFSYGYTMKESDHSLVRYLKAQKGFLGWILNKDLGRN